MRREPDWREVKPIKGRAKIEADCLWKLNTAGRPLCARARACVLSLKKPNEEASDWKTPQGSVFY